MIIIGGVCSVVVVVLLIVINMQYRTHLCVHHPLHPVCHQLAHKRKHWSLHMDFIIFSPQMYTPLIKKKTEALVWHLTSWKEKKEVLRFGQFEDALLQMRNWSWHKVQYLYLCGGKKGNWKILTSLNISLFNIRCQRINLKGFVICNFNSWGSQTLVGVHYLHNHHLLSLWASTHFVIETFATQCSLLWDFVGFEESQRFQTSECIMQLKCL